MQPFRSAAGMGRLMGYAGPPSRTAAEVLSKYIIVAPRSSAGRQIRRRSVYRKLRLWLSARPPAQ
ncbi:MAG TPA: hypothetical protein VFR19_12395, partial [Hyphomicrobiaceae bacterium]|nr:hypothetical protein [Hyphomicrobiaceae bacterium]